MGAAAGTRWDGPGLLQLCDPRLGLGALCVRGPLSPKADTAAVSTRVLGPRLGLVLECMEPCLVT